MKIERNTILLIASTLVASWLGMQCVHEFGHCIGAWLTGGIVERVNLKPWLISQTILSHNPQPLAVVWAGPIVGVVLPLFLWLGVAFFRLPFTFLFRFFAGFCLVVNGLYIGIGSFFQIGDCGDMLLYGSNYWQLWLFGIITVPLGFLLWNGQGRYFGLGNQPHNIRQHTFLFVFLSAIVLIIFGSIF